MPSLKGKVALVTGASRGIGKGIALVLGQAGATVYMTARTLTKNSSPTRYTGSLNQTAREIKAAGGKAIPIQCDHSNDKDVQKVFKRIERAEKKLDILVNNAWSGYERLRDPDSDTNWRDDFWKIPLEIWDETHIVGVRSNYISSAVAAPLMVKQKNGLIVNLSFFDGQKYLIGNIPYTLSKSTTDRMAHDMAIELKPHNVACVSLYPGFIAPKSKNIPGTESVEFIGRAVTALASDPDIMQKTGKTLIAAKLAREYGFTDTDGTLPPVLNTKTVLKRLTS